jgi:hypothetical protein
MSRRLKTTSLTALARALLLAASPLATAGEPALAITHEDAGLQWGACPATGGAL